MLKKLQDMINKSSNNALSTLTGMVYQVWDDGEITLQKSGDLLWQRTLHCRKPAIKVIEDLEWTNTKSLHGYIFASEKDCEVIREMIKDIAILDIKAS